MSTSHLLNQQFDDSEDEDDNFNPAPADMSDDENGGATNSRNAQSRRDADDSDDERPAPRRRSPAGSDGDNDDRNEEDEEQREDEDEDDEDEDDDEEEITGHRRKRRRERRNQFLDVEAEVDEDEEDQDDDEEELNELKDNFIADTHPDDLADLPDGRDRDDRRHRELDRRREMEASMDAEKQAEILRQRYANRRSGAGLADSAVVPKRLLLPSVDDPSIWAVRCKEGKEREAIFSIMKRIEERFGTKDELAITSVFERGGTTAPMRGFVYVEALRQADVMTACEGIMNVYPHTKMQLVEIKEMPALLRVTKTPPLEAGAYVRLRRPLKYQGDLAQVIDVTENGLEVRVRFVPRLDYGLNDDGNAPLDAAGKRKRAFGAGPKPPQRLFSDVEAKKRHARFLTNPQPKVWIYMGDEYVNGFCEKDVKIQALTTQDVNPTLEEVTKFASGAEDGTESLDLNALATSLKASTANATYLPGDIIEVYEGEQKGVVGKAISVQSDIVTMAVAEGPLKGQTIEVPVKGLRKRFKEGDHVKVIGGSHFRDEVGMVVKITQDRVTLVTDQNLTEITVFSKDLREASDSGGAGSLGQYNLWDLVQLDPSTVACVVKIDRESMIVLDQNNQSRMVLPSQIANKIERRRGAVATDRNGSEIRTDDVVKEYSGENRKGKIIHIYRSYLFLHSDEIQEHAGVIVTRTTSVSTVSAKGGRITNQNGGADLTQMDPSKRRNVPGADMPPPPKSFGRDHSIGQTVIIRRGPYKGLLGIVKDTTDTHARVELHSKNKIANVEKEFLTFKDKFTGQTLDPTRRGGFGGRGGARGGFSGGPSRNAWEAGGRTPMGAGNSDRVPAWGSRTPSAAAVNGGRTPAWKAGGDGGRTPFWQNDGSRTTNPYDGSRTAYGSGSRTPAWASGAKTPAYGDSGFGSKTPSYDAWGAKTPAHGGSSSEDKWSSNAGGWGSAGHGVYDAPTPGASLSAPTPAAMNAPTPGAYDAPTPGASLSAPTPAAMNAPTPGAYSAPTPAAAPNWGSSGWGGPPESAPTPAALSAPTPGASGGYYSAPTPGGYGNVPETPGASGWGADDAPRYTDDD